MNLLGEQVLMRAYLRNADRVPFGPTHERLVRAARSQGLSGATVFRGIMGYGSHGVIKLKRWSVVERVPVIVEIVDTAEKIIRFVEGPVDDLMIGGMITLERANVMMYRHRRHEEPNHLRLGELLRPLSTMPTIEVRGHMTTKQDGVLLRIFIGEDDRTDGKYLYEAIIQKARELGLAGATVLRGSEGFGAHSVIHKANFTDFSADLPILIEMVDSKEKVNRLLPYLETVVKEGIITMEYVLILLYRHGAADGTTP
jgi:uncharacterized protein